MAAAPESEREGGSRRFLALLAVPAFGLALAITTVTTYLPVRISEISGPAVAGALIGAEGALALVVPALVGAWSDRVDTRLGRRLPFVLAGVPFMVVGLVGMAVTGTLWLLALALAVFYLGYFVCYTPYRAMYPDLVPESVRGRSQGAQNASREVGLGLALVGGGVLMSAWMGLPFVVSAVALTLVMAAFVRQVRRTGPSGDDSGASEEGRSTLWRSWGILRENAEIRRLMAANALWEAALGALKTFVVLFITVGLGRQASVASAALAVVAVAVVVAALVSGRLADRFGPARLIFWALWIYGFGLLVPIFVHSLWVLVALFPLAFAAGVVMTLPYSVLMGLLPDDDHGSGSGAFEASRGVGVMAGPLIAGVAVEVLRPVFSSTEGYAAAFAVAALAIFASLPIAYRLRASGA